MKSVVILGAGLIGKTIAADLCGRYKVTCADINPAALEALRKKCDAETVVVDLSDEQKLRELIVPFDLVIGAVPGFMGYKTLETVLNAGKNVVDISFFPEDPFRLDALAKEKNVTAVVDCGVAPGMCNIFAGYHFARTKVTRYECLVGGLPVVREWPFEYKAVFSPADVIEEYTRPARYVENAKNVTAEPLSDIEQIPFDEIGQLESFNTDGLRTLAVTMHGVPNMKEKTLRYPGHAELMKIFREAGFFSKVPVKIRTTPLVPLEFTSRLLFPQWEMKPGEEDFTVMRVTIEDENERTVYSLLDRFDRETQTSSMARTTGYTCTAAASLLLENKFTQRGICPPEYLGADETCFRSILNHLAERGVHYATAHSILKQHVTA